MVAQPYNIQKQQMSKAQLLQVQYKQDQGLSLQWNFTNPCTNSIYFRHILVLLTQNTQEANSLLKIYLKRIKPGDFYYIIYFDELREMKHVGWKEKPVVEEKPSEKPIIKKNIALGNKEKILQILQQFHKEFNQPIVVSILTDRIDEKEDFEERVLKARCNGVFDFMVAFFAPVDTHKFSYGETISCFSTLKGEYQKIVEFFLSQVYSAGLISVKLIIECLNGSITSMTAANWKTPSFTTIQKVFHGPSLKYDKDILCLYDRKRMECHQQLCLKLEFVTLERRKFKTQKVISVHFGKEFYQNTFNMHPWSKSYHADKDIWLAENPYTTFTVIKFQGNDDN